MNWAGGTNSEPGKAQEGSGRNPQPGLLICPKDCGPVIGVPGRIRTHGPEDWAMNLLCPDCGTRLLADPQRDQGDTENGRRDAGQSPQGPANNDRKERLKANPVHSPREDGANSWWGLWVLSRAGRGHTHGPHRSFGNWPQDFAEGKNTGPRLR